MTEVLDLKTLGVVTVLLLLVAVLAFRIGTRSGARQNTADLSDSGDLLAFLAQTGYSLQHVQGFWCCTSDGGVKGLPKATPQDAIRSAAAGETESLL